MSINKNDINIREVAEDLEISKFSRVSGTENGIKLNTKIGISIILINGSKNVMIKLNRSEINSLGDSEGKGLKLNNDALNELDGLIFNPQSKPKLTTVKDLIKKSGLLKTAIFNL